MNNELYHFNPNHDRLGRFARSSGGIGKMARSARSAQKNLNKLDERQAKIQDKLDTKRMSANKRERYQNSLAENKKFTESLLRESHNKGYSVTSNNVIRDARRGKRFVNTLFLGPAVSQFLNNGKGLYSGTNYRVRKKYV